jgi:osmotically-inducible protein OsmY
MAISTRTDEDIQADVLEELKWDTRVRPNEIGVAVKDGIVTLTGWVDSYLKKMAAEEAAHRAIGGLSMGGFGAVCAGTRAPAYRLSL